MPAHHFNAGTMCPRGRKLIEGRGTLRERAKLVCHCVLLELSDRLVLIDTGIGSLDVEDPERVTRTMRRLLHPRFDRAETAVARVRALGFDPRDVRDIIVTHLDFDHAGGLADFPHARVHVYASEHAAAMERTTAMGHQRYRPSQWAHGPQWVLYETRGDAWFGFEAVRDLEGLPHDVLLIPLIGHTPGHCGIAFQDRGSWKLHAGDAYFFHDEMKQTKPSCPTGLRLYQTLMEASREARRGNQDRLRKLLRDHGKEVEVFCSHDAAELERRPARARPSSVSVEAR